MRIGWSVVAGLGMAGLLFAAKPAQAQMDTSKSKSGSTSSEQQPGTMGSTGSQAGMASAQNEVTGKVDKLDQVKKELTLRLPVSDDTQVTKDGKRATLSDIKEGDQVRASFSGSGDQIKVNRIDVMSTGASTQPGTAPAPSESPSGSSSGSTGTRGY